MAVWDAETNVSDAETQVSDAEMVVLASRTTVFRTFVPVNAVLSHVIPPLHLPEIELKSLDQLSHLLSKDRHGFIVLLSFAFMIISFFFIDFRFCFFLFPISFRFHIAFMPFFFVFFCAPADPRIVFSRF